MKPLIGGQAIIEGVMMKGPKHYSVAVRKQNGNIKIKTESLKNRNFKPFNWPIIRGFINLIDMLIIGLKSLQWSANQLEDSQEEISYKEYAFLLIFSLSFAIGLFIILPLFLTKLLINTRGIWFNILDGVLRMIIFILYLLIIGFMKDIKTLFQYHGAEHKTVNCYEAGQELNIQNTKKFTTLHPRCGTSFILIVLILSIALFSLITNESWLIKLAVRIIFIPIIAGLSYEILHYSAKNKENKLLNILIKPGLYLQKLTTKEPNDRQIEVAIEALNAVLLKSI